MRRGDGGPLRRFVAKYTGDGVLVYFGYPRAHEDDAERSVGAGLELIGAVNALEVGSPPSRESPCTHQAGSDYSESDRAR